MNIGQKHTLFMIGLMLTVLCAVSLSGVYLVRQHVNEAIDRDITRAHAVFVEAQKSAFAQLQDTARTLTREPSLLAATQTGDAGTVRGMLGDLFPRPGIDMVALYLQKGASNVIAEGRKPHYTSPQMLSSSQIEELVRRVQKGAPVAYGNALIFDSFLRLTAIPIENPLGGAVGVILVGDEVNQEAIVDIKELLRTEVALFHNNVVLGSTLEGLQLDELNYPDERKLLSFDIGDEGYTGHVFQVLAGDGQTDIAHLLLAHSNADYWAPYLAFAKQALTFSVLILLISALVGIWVSRITLTRPIGILAEATRRIAAGEWGYKVNLGRRDELGQLAQSFNQMLDDLGQSQGQLESSRKRFHDFAESSSDWLWETDQHGRFVFVSTSVSATLGLNPVHFSSKTLAELFPRDDLVSFMLHIQPDNQRYLPFKNIECVITLADGGRHHLRMNGIPVLEDGEFHGYRGTASDITQQKHDEERMVMLANQDQLTGLSNRRRFLVDFAHEIRRTQSRDGYGVLMLIDLDHLKMINDTAGHAVGDELITQVADAIKQLSRREDMLARVSGDEFAIVFPDMETKQAEYKAQEILKLIGGCRPRQIKSAVNITASIGIVEFPEQSREAVELMAMADTAMYAAKDAGRNRVRVYSEEDMQRQRMGTQLAWKTRIVEALEKDKFVLAFQPIASVVDGDIHHFETLVRMLDDDGKLILPGNFIPTAEQFGLIGQLDQMIVKKAMRQLAALPTAMSDVGISINLSGLSVGNQDMLNLIESTLKRTGINPARLTFEVTETAACENMARAQEFISRIRQLGCKISLDDFGVGFSSFSYLKNLKVDILKIDGSFIRDIVKSPEDQLFVKALVDVARGMGIHTVAEFVEDDAAFSFLRRVGVDYAQGWFIGKPKEQMNVSPVDVAALGNKPVVVNQ